MRKKNNTVNPTGLKGQEQMDHIRGLMGKLSTISESTKAIPSVNVSKKAPDGNVYAIIRENSEFYIKVAKQSDKLSVNDFNYIGGLANKRDFVYETYNKATKVLNNKLTSLYEAYDIQKSVDTFHSDKLVIEENATGAAGMGFMSEEDTTKLMEDADNLLEGDDDVCESDDCEKDKDLILGDDEIDETKKPQSIFDAMTNDDEIIPEGYKELIFKKKRLK